PPIGSARPPASIAAGRATVDGLALAPHDRVLVVARAGDKEVATVASLTDLDAQPAHGIDPSLGLRRVRGEFQATDPTPVDWSAAVTAGQRAIAHELVGASRKMLELARTHARE